LVRTTSGGDEVDDDDYSLSDGHSSRNKAIDIKQYKTIFYLFICIGKNYYYYNLQPHLITFLF